MSGDPQGESGRDATADEEVAALPAVAPPVVATANAIGSSRQFGEGTGAVVVVRLGPVEFGIPIGQVREVLRTPPLTRIPFPPPSVLGAVAVRGSIVPVLDLGWRLRQIPVQLPGRLVVVLAGEPPEPLALLVDQVCGLADPTTAVLPTPPEAEATLPAGWITGVLVPEPDRPVTLLRLEPVVDVRSARQHGEHPTSSDPFPKHA